MDSKEHETFVIANIDDNEETNTSKEKTQPNLTCASLLQLGRVPDPITIG